MERLQVTGTDSDREVAARADSRAGTAGGRAETAPGSRASIRQTVFRLGSTEPPLLTLLRELLGPGTAVLALCACMWADGDHLSAEFWALAIIVFLVCQRVLTTPELRTGGAGQHEVWPTLPRLLLEWGCISALFLFVVTALHLSRFVGPRALTAWFVCLPVVLIGSRSVAIRLGRRWSRTGPNAGRHIIIGATEAGLELAKRVQQGSSARQFLGFSDFRDPVRLPLPASGHWIGACDGVAEFVKRNAVDAIYIALPISSETRIAQLVQQLRDTTASIYFVPANIFDFHLVQPRCTEIHGIPALAVCETPHQGLSGLGKRIFDLLLASLGLLLAAPLLLLIAATVKLSSPGPVLFRQRRYGLNGEQIVVYKFRSMTVCEDGASVTQATRNDARTTRLGRILRRYSLDELPQLLNVLEGRMSLVGPRPHAIAHNEQYRKLIGGYMIRHKVRPGITGWAQVNGFRGGTETLDKMRRRIELDIDYLNNWSLGLDVKILLRTVRLLVRDQQAY